MYKKTIYERLREDAILNRNSASSDNPNPPLEYIQHSFQNSFEPQPLLQELDSVEHEIIKVRNNDIKQLEKDFVDLHEITKSLSLLVVDQGESIEQIVQNVDKSVIHTDEGVKHLEKASDIQLNTTKRKITWTAIFTSTGVIIGGAVLTAFHPFIGIPIIGTGIAGIGISVKAGKLI